MLIKYFDSKKLVFKYFLANWTACLIFPTRINPKLKILSFKDWWLFKWSFLIVEKIEGILFFLEELGSSIQRIDAFFCLFLALMCDIICISVV